MTTIAEYFRQWSAERVLLIHIKRTDATSKTYVLSDRPYATDASDTPASIRYSHNLRPPGLPELKRTLALPFEGGASTAFGNLNFAKAEAVYYTTTPSQGSEVMVIPRGTPIDIYLAAPRRLYPRSDAVLLARGKVGRLNGDHTGGVTVSFVDATRDISEAKITIDPAAGPLGYGQVMFAEPFPVDTSLLEYAFNRVASQSLDAVYDDGVLLTLTTDYTVDLTTSRFRLTGAPVGRITCDFKGAKISGTWLQSTQAVLTNLLSLAGVGLSTSFSLPSGLIGYYITQTTTLGSIFSDLLKACAGYWLVSRTGGLVFAQYPAIAAGTAYSTNKQFNATSWSEIDELYSSVPFQYRTCWTRFQVKPDATTAIATFANSDGLSSVVTLASPVAEYVYTASPLLRTYFHDLADAEDVAQFLLDLYSQVRKVIDVTIPFTETIGIGSNITLSFAGASYDCAVVELGDIFSGDYPQMKIKAIA